jgi:DNA-binding response OmpR family regulator
MWQNGDKVRRTAMNKNFEQIGVSRRILLVAADKIFREWSASTLREAGYCAHCRDGAEAGWEELCRCAYRLLIIEQKLPGKSGLRLVLKMGQTKLTLPVLLITASPLPFDPQTHRELRSVTVLPRPFDADRLLEIVCVTLRSVHPAKPVLSRLPLINTGDDSPLRARRWANGGSNPNTVQLSAHSPEEDPEFAHSKSGLLSQHPSC